MYLRALEKVDFQPAMLVYQLHLRKGVENYRGYQYASLDICQGLTLQMEGYHWWFFSILMQTIWSGSGRPSMKMMRKRRHMQTSPDLCECSRSTKNHVMTWIGFPGGIFLKKKWGRCLVRKFPAIFCRTPSIPNPSSLFSQLWIHKNPLIGSLGGFKDLLFFPRSRGKWSNMTNIFFKRVVQSPTSSSFGSWVLRCGYWAQGWTKASKHPYSGAKAKMRLASDLVLFIWMVPTDGCLCSYVQQTNDW